jgi:hypothetical protein
MLVDIHVAMTGQLDSTESYEVSFPGLFHRESFEGKDEGHTALCGMPKAGTDQIMPALQERALQSRTQQKRCPLLASKEHQQVQEDHLRGHKSASQTQQKVHITNANVNTVVAYIGNHNRESSQRVVGTLLDAIDFTKIIDTTKRVTVVTISYLNDLKSV